MTVSGNASYSTPAGYTLPTTTVAGTYQWIASYGGDSNNQAVTDNDPANEQVTVSPASPAINTTQQPASAVVGSSIADKATAISGGYNPSGTVTFNLYNNPNGTGTPLFTDTEPLSGGTSHFRRLRPTTATGTDYWVATYNGDSKQHRDHQRCRPSKPVTLTPATPAINTTQQPASAIVPAASIADEATVSGGFNPTGTVTFNLYSNPNGTGTPLFTVTEPLLHGGSEMATSAELHRQLPPAPTIGSPPTTATATTPRLPAATTLEPVTVNSATPSDRHSSAVNRRHHRHGFHRRQSHHQRRV